MASDVSDSKTVMSIFWPKHQSFNTCGEVVARSTWRGKREGAVRPEKKTAHTGLDGNVGVCFEERALVASVGTNALLLWLRFLHKGLWASFAPSNDSST